MTDVRDNVVHNEDMVRYSVITEKNPREIVLLRGKGCAWRRCTFCDYHLDFDCDQSKNNLFNKEILSHVTGQYNMLEVINSGSFVDLDSKTLEEIKRVCIKKHITELHFECHYMHRKAIAPIKQWFMKDKIAVKMKLGVETFDYSFRETVLKKGIADEQPEIICNDFDEVCLLFGFTGQTAASMRKDIETALANVERVCVNVFQNNTTAMKEDRTVIETFAKEVAPEYENNPRVDILFHNTDYGVGAKDEKGK